MFSKKSDGPWLPDPVFYKPSAPSSTPRTGEENKGESPSTCPSALFDGTPSLREGSVAKGTDAGCFDGFNQVMIDNPTTSDTKSVSKSVRNSVAPLNPEEEKTGVFPKEDAVDEDAHAEGQDTFDADEEIIPTRDSIFISNRKGVSNPNVIADWSFMDISALTEAAQSGSS